MTARWRASFETVQSHCALGQKVRRRQRSVGKSGTARVHEYPPDFACDWPPIGLCIVFNYWRITLAMREVSKLEGSFSHENSRGNRAVSTKLPIFSVFYGI